LQWTLKPKRFPQQSLSWLHGSPFDTQQIGLMIDPPLAQVPLQQSALPPHPVPGAPHVVVDVVLLEVLVLLELLVLLPEVVEVVAELHVVPVASVDANGQPGLHAWPDGQHLRLDPDPHGVVPDGHPHRPWARLMHATPLLQQLGPHGVRPLAQQQPVEACEHAPPAGQHASPHTGWPAGQVTAAPPRKGLSTVAAAAAAAAAPSTLSALRRDVEAAIVRASPSNRSAMSSPRHASTHSQRSVKREGRSGGNRRSCR
jgi:hypothetical protein